MLTLSSLKDTTRQKSSFKRVGRGIGSGKGKTCGRGEKGAGSRSGYKTRQTYEGGQFRLFQKLPIRGFSRARFQKRLHTINLHQINQLYSDGDLVNLETLKKRGFINGPSYGVKVLGEGNIEKKVSIEVNFMSKSARDKCQEAKITCTTLSKNKK